MVTIHTKNLVLRDFEDDDWRDVHEYATDPEVSKYMEWGPNTEKETRDFVKMACTFRRQDPRRNYEFGIFLPTEKKIIGGCGLTIYDSDMYQGALGYTLNRNYWNRGIVTEAAGALLRYGFEKLALHRINATCDVQNIGSAAVMRKLGMRQEAHFLEERKIKGTWRDTYLYAILGSEWKKMRNEKRLEV